MHASLRLAAALFALLFAAGCGTTSMNAVSGEAQSIGHNTSGYSNTEQGTVWNALAPPSHTTLLPDRSFDVISPIQPSVIAVKVDPSGEGLPLDVFLSSASDYQFERAHFEQLPDGSLSLLVEGFGAERSGIYQAVMQQTYEAVTAQVESGSITQREALQTLGLVAQALAELGINAFAPGMTPGIPTP